jgi:hypothetical protein
VKSRAVVGKTIRRVHQVRWWPGLDNSRRSVWSLEAIEFTDGSVLRFMVQEGDGEYGIEAIYPAREIES